jgi:DNA-binding response OmpR family regulator
MEKSSARRQNAILVVEDEDLLRHYAADVLQEAGFEALEAADADAALALIRSRPDVRVLFTDIELPGELDGMELARKVQQESPHVFVLVTSGKHQPSRTEMADDGRFLPKPYTRDEVIREINTLEREAEIRSRRGL